MPIDAREKVFDLGADAKRQEAEKFLHMLVEEWMILKSCLGGGGHLFSLKVGMLHESGESIGRLPNQTTSRTKR